MSIFMYVYGNPSLSMLSYRVVVEKEGAVYEGKFLMINLGDPLSPNFANSFRYKVNGVETSPHEVKTIDVNNLAEEQYFNYAMGYDEYNNEFFKISRYFHLSANYLSALMWRTLTFGALLSQYLVQIVTAFSVVGVLIFYLYRYFKRRNRHDLNNPYRTI